MQKIKGNIVNNFTIFPFFSNSSKFRGDRALQVLCIFFIYRTTTGRPYNTKTHMNLYYFDISKQYKPCVFIFLFLIFSKLYPNKTLFIFNKLQLSLSLSLSLSLYSCNGFVCLHFPFHLVFCFISFIYYYNIFVFAIFFY